VKKLDLLCMRSVETSTARTLARLAGKGLLLLQWQLLKERIGAEIES